ncbi:amidohydrolase family protein [Adhaeribacter radiodurans]|uniref:Amidohydrolase family protein n=1 Tax=Adhaeribacter radiodurans TaxID=2745197 RepID=A0A7L7LEP5_9BACT|nr:amidohydrolase family protein [Adhaeribacter radiodurans]QMU31253.1 amidohydrolase family protein [Adhaeribacter radiodurans]
MKCTILLSALFFTFTSWAQVPAPAPKQAKPVLLTGATLHVGNGLVIEKAAVAFDKGKITYAGPASGAPTATGYEVIEVSGQHIYPGLIQPNTQLGLTDISSVRATRDEQEVGVFNPNVRSLIAYNTDSDILPTIRANGVLLVQATPVGGTISGSSSVMQLDAWNWEDAAVKADDGLHLNWPTIPRAPQPESRPNISEAINNREKALQELQQLFTEAAVFSREVAGKENLKLVALKGLFDGSKRLYIHADAAKEIIEGIRFAKKNNVKNIVLVGGYDSWKITDFLKEQNVPVIISGIHILPNRTVEDVDLPYKLPNLLQQAGILYCLQYDGALHGHRNLPFIAGTAVAYGLTKEQALSAVTANTAKILGVDQQTGTIAAGKDANLVISAGDLLDMRTNNVTAAYIQGRKINLTDKQKALYQKFKEKYEAEK